LARVRRIIKVLIADENVLFRRGLQSLISAESDMRVLDDSGEFADALAKARLLHPDVFILDVSLLRESSVEKTSSLRQAQLSCAVLWLTLDDRKDDLQLAVSAGARAYMLKTSTPAELVAGVRQIALHSNENSNAISRMIPDLQALAASSQARTVALTTREQEIARLFAEGCTARQAAYELGLSIKTVEAHKLNLMRKLDIHNRAGLVAYARQSGLIPEPAAQ